MDEKIAEMSKKGVGNPVTTKQQCAEMRKDLDGCVYSRRELEALLDSYEAVVMALRLHLPGDRHAFWCHQWPQCGTCPCGHDALRQYDGEAG